MPAAISLRVALVAALLAHLFATLWLTPPAHLNVDECTYHLMLRGAAEGTLGFWNGYAERPSAELVWPTVVAHAGRLVPITPPFYAAVAWPFFALGGFAGLFLMNALLFVAWLVLTARLARAWLGDERLAAIAVAVLAFATYGWEYSQAAWPHMLSSVVVVGALLAGHAALAAETAAARGRAGLLAGALLGFGVGVRLDVLLAAPAVLLPLCFAAVPQRRAIAAVLLGALPPPLLLTFMNYLKFGIASPLTYGPRDAPSGDWTRYLPVAGVGLLLAGAVWAARRPALARWLRGHRAAVVAGLVAALCVALWVPELRALLERLARGVGILLVDLRGLPERIVRPALSRSAGDGLVYFGHLKKAWLQSLPYLALLVLPAAAALRGGRERPALVALALLPLTQLAAFGFFAWDGGMALNLRYLTPALPCVAILTAWALRELGRGGGATAWGVGAWAGVALFWLLSRTRRSGPDAMELFVLDVPLAIAAALLLAALAFQLRASAPRRAAARGLAALALVWAGLVAFTYDYPAVRWLRGYHAALSASARDAVPDDALFFTTHPDPFCGLLDAERVLIALPAADDYADFRALADFHLAAGRPVLAALPEPAWRALERAPRFAGLRSEEVLAHPVFSLRRIERQGAR